MRQNSDSSGPSLLGLQVQDPALQTGADELDFKPVFSGLLDQLLALAVELDSHYPDVARTNHEALVANHQLTGAAGTLTRGMNSVVASTVALTLHLDHQLGNASASVRARTVHVHLDNTVDDHTSPGEDSR